MTDPLCSELWRPLLKHLGSLPYKRVQLKFPERSGELGHVMCEVRLRTMGLSILEKGRLRGAEGECGTSMMKDYKEKEPGSSQRCTKAIRLNKAILIDICGKKPITLEYVPRKAVELLSLRVFMTQCGQAPSLTVKWALLCAGYWTGWTIEVLSNPNCSVIVWFPYSWHASTDAFPLPQISIRRLCGKIQQWERWPRHLCISGARQQLHLEELLGHFPLPLWLHAVLPTGQVAGAFSSPCL